MQAMVKVERNTRTNKLWILYILIDVFFRIKLELFNFQCFDEDSLRTCKQYRVNIYFDSHTKLSYVLLLRVMCSLLWEYWVCYTIIMKSRGDCIKFLMCEYFCRDTIWVYEEVQIWKPTYRIFYKYIAILFVNCRREKRDEEVQIWNFTYGIFNK